jgi:hypothetical protein
LVLGRSAALVQQAHKQILATSALPTHRIVAIEAG